MCSMPVGSAAIGAGSGPRGRQPALRLAMLARSASASRRSASALARCSAVSAEMVCHFARRLSARALAHTSSTDACDTVPLPIGTDGRISDRASMGRPPVGGPVSVPCPPDVSSIAHGRRGTIPDAGVPCHLRASRTPCRAPGRRGVSDGGGSVPLPAKKKSDWSGAS